MVQQEAREIDARSKEFDKTGGRDAFWKMAAMCGVFGREVRTVYHFQRCRTTCTRGPQLRGPMVSKREVPPAISAISYGTS